MHHGNGIISSFPFLLFVSLAAVIHRCGSGSASAPMLATFGAGSDGTAECPERRRARVGRSLEQDCTAGPSAPARHKTYGVGRPGGGYSLSGETRQVGRQREGVDKLELRDEGLRGSIGQQLTEDMTSTEISTDALSNESVTLRKDSSSMQLRCILIMLRTGKALDRVANAPHGWSMEACRMLFQAHSPKNKVRLVVMMLEALAFPLDTNDVVNSFETMERKIKEFEGNAIRRAEE